MGIFSTIGNEMGRAVDAILEKNRKSAMINRIRILIKNERENTARAYVALGKYYYENLRDPENEQTEHLCLAVDESGRRMKKAFDKLDELTAPAEEADGCGDCNEDCSLCPYGEDLALNPIAADEDNVETDIPEKPFINALHDEAAAREERETAEQAAAAAEAAEAMAELAEASAEAEKAAEFPEVVVSESKEEAEDE